MAQNLTGQCYIFVPWTIDLPRLSASKVFSSMTSKPHTIIRSRTAINVAHLTVFDILRVQLHMVFYTISRMTQGE
jgi:hypothetical protein